jgi:hypothetical protein
MLGLSRLSVSYITQCCFISKLQIVAPFQLIHSPNCFARAAKQLYTSVYKAIFISVSYRDVIFHQNKC